MENYTETIEQPQLASVSDLPVADNPPSYHTILEVWDKVLEPARVEAKAKISPQWAVRITSTYPTLTFGDMGRFQEIFYGMIEDLHEILKDQIKGDTEAFTRTELEVDREENRNHYLALLTKWQVYILQCELDWEWQDPDAAIKLAALSEVHKLFLGEQGLTGHLEQIGFEFTEEDQENLSQVLAAVRDEGVSSE